MNVYKMGIFDNQNRLLFKATCSAYDEDQAREFAYEKFEMNTYAEKIDEDICVSKENDILSKALANVIDVLKNDGTDLEDIAEITGLKQYPDLKRVFIDIYKEEQENENL